NRSSVGQTIRFTATVSAVAPGSSVGGTPTGMVTFFDGSTSLGQAPLSTASGVATATYSSSSLTAGNHTITASYTGDGNFVGSSGTLAGGQTVTNTGSRATYTQVSSSSNPVQAGRPVTLTATIFPLYYYYILPTGTVQFQVDGSNFGAPV